MSRILYPHMKYDSNQHAAYVSIFQLLIYNKGTFNSIKILKMLVETHLYSASEYIMKHNQGFVPTHEVTNILPWIHIPVLIYNQRTFNSIKILKKLIETHFYSASEYLYTMYILEASEYLYTKFYISIYICIFFYN